MADSKQYNSRLGSQLKERYMRMTPVMTLFQLLNIDCT